MSERFTRLVPFGAETMVPVDCANDGAEITENGALLHFYRTSRAKYPAMRVVKVLPLVPNGMGGWAMRIDHGLANRT